MNTYSYHVNLDERGSYFADVRDGNGETVYEVRAGDSLDDDDSSIFEDGFMRDPHDMDGLAEYLADLGVIDEGSTIKYEG